MAGAGYGFLGGTVYAWMAGTIDALTFRDLPMQVDWAQLLRLWAIAGLGLALLGAVTGWPRERWRSVVLGAAGLAVTVFAVNLALASKPLLVSIFITLLALAPSTVLCLPVTFLLRWLAQKHVEALAQARWRDIALAVFIAVLLGALPGVTQRMSPEAQIAVRLVHTTLQSKETSELFMAPPNFAAHAGAPYGLRQNQSAFSTEGYDVHVRFAEGYVITCVSVIYSGQKAFIRGCAEGREPPR